MPEQNVDGGPGTLSECHKKIFVIAVVSAIIIGFVIIAVVIIIIVIDDVGVIIVIIPTFIPIIITIYHLIIHYYHFLIIILFTYIALNINTVMRTIVTPAINIRIISIIIAFIICIIIVFGKGNALFSKTRIIFLIVIIIT